MLLIYRNVEIFILRNFNEFFFVKVNKICILKYFIFNIESLKYKNYFDSGMLDLPDMVSSTYWVFISYIDILFARLVLVKPFMIP